VIGLDTNVLVRYLTQDEPRQAALANELIETRLAADTPGFVSTVALIELVWVLEAGMTVIGRRSSRCSTLLRAKPFVIEHADVAWQAADVFAA
jgi:predicted nucleic-acid-binding protein